MFPKFIGIGAQKAGTTWLHQNLAAHPEVWMPERKEIHYFNRKKLDRSSVVSRLLRWDETGGQWRRQVGYRLVRDLVGEPSVQNLRWDYNYYMRPYDDRWYASIFEPGERFVTGEITPAYSALGRDAVAQIYEVMPDAKIIFMMRNPIERVWSQTVMSLDKTEKGSVDKVRKNRMVRKLDRRTDGYLTNYRRTLENWGAFYPPEQIFVGFLEDIHFAPAELLSSVYGFLGVDPAFEPHNAREKVHSRSASRMPVKFATQLAHSLREEISWLGERFGGYASFWLHCAERLIEDPPASETIPYPLYESAMWDEWVARSENSLVGLRSGVLGSVRGAR